MDKRDPRNTTLYNHKRIGTDELPLISNSEYFSVYNNVISGNTDYYYEWCKIRTFEPKQQKIIEDIIHKRIIK